MNWSQYNTNLTQRGNINFWISEDIESWWFCKKEDRRGRPFVYSDRAIEVCLTLQYMFGLPLRAAQGFVDSIFQRSNIRLQAPCYSQVSRRMSKIQLQEIRIPKCAQVNLAFDSTGLKVYGEGEWKVRTHGFSKRRVWRKLHIGVDVQTLEITHSMLTTHSKTDANAVEQMLADEAPDAIKSILGDGAYDKGCVYHCARRINAKTIIPPAHNARIQRAAIDPAKVDRDRIIAQIKLLGGNSEGRKLWKQCSGYHQRSLAETTMYRFKNAFTHRLRNRLFANQLVESAVKINILNAFTFMGIPRTC